ncbi:hypothetical protein DID74_00235 [Candidatus Marinamargulisbacteria bacterium SCGC AG-333-B06]|nr:hypothetical protein DID74_00235 [Candidatus Marinamargulisbacteria bacterium SCGC AG-333-B06]
MKVLLLADNYPCKSYPYKGRFVFNFFKALRKYHDVTVISPRVFLKESLFSYETDSDYYPILFSFSNKKIWGFYPLRFLNNFFKKQLIFWIAKKYNNKKPDVIYAHFISMGMLAKQLAQIWNIPYMIAIGENNIDAYHYINQEDIKFAIQDAKHLIAVSKKNHNIIQTKYGVNTKKITYLPNGIDSSIFKVMDPVTCRHQLGLALDSKIVIFVGHFIHRKGPDRVLEAIKKSQVPDLKLVLIGKGKPLLDNEHIIFQGTLSHDKLPLYLNAADIFVLPTLSEGMPNATLEAMGCGLPIVTSDLDFNREFLDDTSACLIDPLDTDAIAREIDRLFMDANAMKLYKQRSLEVIQNYTIEKRVKRFNEISL